MHKKVNCTLQNSYDDKFYVSCIFTAIKSRGGERMKGERDNEEGQNGKDRVRPRVKERQASRGEKQRHTEVERKMGIGRRGGER